MDHLIKYCENIYRWAFAGGDLSVALRKLKSKDMSHVQYHGSACMFGVQLGISVTLISWIVHCLSTTNENHTHLLALVYFGLSTPLILCLLMVANAMIFQAYRINYVAILRFNHTRCLHPVEYGDLIGNILVIFIGFCLLSIEGVMDPYIAPLHQPWLLIAIIVASLAPSPVVDFRSSRLWLIVSLARLFTIPLNDSCEFRDFFLADQLMSLGTMFNAIAIIIYYTGHAGLDDNYSITGGLYAISFWAICFSVIPPLIRIFQCLQRYFGSYSFTQIWNLFKYLTTLVSRIFSFCYAHAKVLADSDPSQENIDSAETWKWVTFAALFAASTYSLGWDLYVDFGLVPGVKPFIDFILRRDTNKQSKDIGAESIPFIAKKAKQEWFLRENHAFPHIFYYFISIMDVILRFLWVVPFLAELEVHPGEGVVTKLSLFYFFGFLEVYRRGQWNILRIELEFINESDAIAGVGNNTSDLFYTDIVGSVAAEKFNVENIQTSETAGKKQRSGSDDGSDDEKDH